MFYIKSSDGTKIAVYDYRCGKKRVKGTVLLVHGWPLSHEIYEYQIGCLVECGYRVLITRWLRIFIMWCALCI